MAQLDGIDADARHFRLLLFNHRHFVPLQEMIDNGRATQMVIFQFFEQQIGSIFTERQHFSDLAYGIFRLFYDAVIEHNAIIISVFGEHLPEAIENFSSRRQDWNQLDAVFFRHHFVFIRLQNFELVKPAGKGCHREQL